MGWMSSPPSLYIIYLELGSLLGPSLMTRDLTKWLHVLNGTAIPLGQIWAYLLGFEVVITEAKNVCSENALF